MTNSGIKALTEGVTSAIAKLGVSGGFLDNPKVTIPLPPALDRLAKGMRMMGRGKDADQLVAAMIPGPIEALHPMPLLLFRPAQIEEDGPDDECRDNRQADGQ